MYWSFLFVAFVLQLNGFGNNNNFVEAGCCGCCCGCCRCCCCPQPPIIIQPPPAIHKICHVPCCCCRPCCCRCCCCGCGGKRRKRETSYRYKLLRQRREVSQFVNCQLTKSAEPLRDEPQFSSDALFPILSTFNLTTASTTFSPTLQSSTTELTTITTNLNVTQSTVLLRAKRSSFSQVAALRPKNFNQNLISNCKC